MRTLLLLLPALFLTACAVGPDYQRPELTPPETWRSRDTLGTVPTVNLADADTAWWELFGDTVMTGLIRHGLTENPDIRIAVARVEEFLGLYGVAKSDFFPKVGLTGTGSRGQFSTSGDGSTERPTTNQFEVGVGATWELDLWGKIRRSAEAARADLLSSEEGRRGVVLSVATLIADSYFQLLSLDQQLVVARETEALRAQSLDLFRQRFDKGDVSELELSQIESQYWLARAQVPAIENAIVRLENALNVLLGMNPGPVPRGLPIDMLTLPPVPEGLPSELLEQRPDVREAEERLIAANARIGVAKSLMFPSISLTGLFGAASNDLSGLFKTQALVWNAGGQLLQPIFRGGEILGQIDAAEAVQRQALAGYGRAVQNAFRDADNALSGRTRIESQTLSLKSQVAALQRYSRLASMRYHEGVTSYLEVLDAERSLFATELEYLQAQASLLQSVVNVYRAFGGGWVDSAAAVSVPREEQVDRRDTGSDAGTMTPDAVPDSPPR